MEWENEDNQKLMEKGERKRREERDRQEESV